MTANGFGASHESDACDIHLDAPCGARAILQKKTLLREQVPKTEILQATEDVETAMRSSMGSTAVVGESGKCLHDFSATCRATSNGPMGYYWHDQYQVCRLPPAKIFSKGLIDDVRGEWCDGCVLKDSQFNMHYKFDCGGGAYMIFHFNFKMGNCQTGIYVKTKMSVNVEGVPPYCVKASLNPSFKMKEITGIGTKDIPCNEGVDIVFSWQQGWSALETNASTDSRKFPDGQPHMQDAITESP